MLKIVIAFAAGIMLDSRIPIPVWGWMSIWAIAALGFLVFRQGRDYLLILLICVGGSTIHAIQTRPTHPDDIRNMDTGEGLYATLEGRLLETPRYRKYQNKGVLSESCQARLEVSWISHQSQRHPVHGVVLLRTRGAVPRSFYKGLKIEVTGVLNTPSGSLATGLFSYRDYLQHQGIYRVLTAESPESWALDHKISQQPDRPWTDTFQAWAMHTMTRGLPEVDDATRLQWAMVLGWKTWLYDEIAEPFRWSGSMHLFAISGLHVAMVAGLLLGSLRICQLPVWMSGNITVLCMWGYIAMSGWQTSAIRAGIMMSILIFGWMFRRPNSMLNSLFSAAWIILIGQPGQLFQTGFQLSFGVALSLVTLADPLRQKLQEWTQPDPWIIRDQLSIFQKIQKWVTRKLALPVAVSLAAWVGSLPIIWQQFHLVTPIGLLGNLLLIPIAGCVISCAMGSFLCAIWAPGITELFNHCGWFWMESMKYLSEWMADLNGSHFFVSPLPPLFLWIYFATLMLIALGTVKSRWKTRAVFISCSILACLFASHLHTSFGKRSITLIPVPHGDSIWINQSGWKNDLLLDGGRTPTMERKTIPFLESQGVDALRSVWISHGDADHIGGLQDGMQRFCPEQIVMSSGDFKSPYFKEIVRFAKNKGIAMVNRVKTEAQTPLKILYPIDERYFQTADDANLVLSLTLGESSILLMGDLSREGLIELGNAHPALKADVLVVNRPRKDDPPNIHWMDQLSPKLIIVTGIEQGRKDRWMEQLHPEAFSSRTIVWDTGAKGSIELVASGDVLKVVPNEGPSLLMVPGKSTRSTHFAQVNERSAQQF